VDGNFSVERLDIRSGATAKMEIISGGGLRTIDTGISSDAAILIISSPLQFKTPKNPQ
jgi:hypothetical protein